jgi:hypothetical protein
MDAKIQPDGSMHSFKKRFHPVTVSEIENEFDHAADVTTPIYPCPDGGLQEILAAFRTKAKTWTSDRKILISSTDVKWCEINMLFYHYKISQREGQGLSSYAKRNPPVASQWNMEYSSWHEMAPWEMREWFSLFYRSWFRPWLVDSSQINDDFLFVTNQDLVLNTNSTVQRILSWCHRTPKITLSEFLEEYMSKQSYILEEYQTIENAVYSVINDTEYHWSPISVVGEAIIQAKLRDHGIEIRCAGLDKFPTSSVNLKSLVYHSQNLHQVKL